MRVDIPGKRWILWNDEGENREREREREREKEGEEGMKGERILVVLGGEGDNKLKGCSINKKQPLKNNQTRCNARQGQQPNASRVLPVFQQQRAAANTRQARQSKTQMCSLLLWIGSLWQLSKILNSSSSAPKATQSGRRNAGLLSGSCIAENS